MTMSNSLLAIPNRSSSWAAFNERKIKHTNSKTDLKRKLSDASLERGSEEYTKLRIEAINLDKEELEMENERLGLERMEKAIDTKVYMKARSKNNKRIISLGDDLWSERRKLRKIYEESGKIALLTPDSENAFAAALLRLYKDPKMGKKRQSAVQSAMRADTIEAYAAMPKADDYLDKSFLRCSLTGKFDKSIRIRAAHIVPYCIGEELASYLFGPDQGLRLNRPDNCLMIHEDIEKAFDNGIITIFPIDEGTRPILRWKVILVNQDARNQSLVLKGVNTIGELDGKEIIFRTDQRPASRFLYYHFIVSLLLCRARENPGWEALWLKYGKTEPWPTPGQYLRQSMLSALARCVGNVDELDFAALANENSFSCSKKLNKDEEDEIARQIIKLFSQNKGRGQRQEDGDNDVIEFEEEDEEEDEDEDEDEDEEV